MEPLNHAKGQVATTSPAATPTHGPPRSRPATTVRPAAIADARAATTTRLWMVPSPVAVCTEAAGHHVEPVTGRLGLPVGHVEMADGRGVLGRVPVGRAVGRRGQPKDQRGHSDEARSGQPVVRLSLPVVARSGSGRAAPSGSAGMLRTRPGALSTRQSPWFRVPRLGPPTGVYPA